MSEITNYDFNKYKNNLFADYGESYSDIRFKLHEINKQKLDDSLRFYFLVCSPWKDHEQNENGVILVGIISLIEALMSDVKFQDPFSYFENKYPNKNSIEDVKEFKESYFLEFGATKKLRAYLLKYFSEQALDRLVSSFTIWSNSKPYKDRPLRDVNEFAALLYSLRSEYVHNASLPLMKSPESFSMIDLVRHNGRDRVLAIRLNVDDFRKHFEESLVQFWKRAPLDLVGFTKTTLTQLPLLDFVDDGSGNRWLQMGGLLHDVLGKYEDPKILDLAMGTGQDSISLLKEGYKVESNDIDDEGIEMAEGQAKKVAAKLSVHRIDWKDFLTTSELKPESFDVVFSLGNSFPNYMLDQKERVDALKGFWKVLKKGGTLIFDTRNFNYILNNKEHILVNPEKNFEFGYRSTYLNRQVKGFPVDISKDRLHYIWKHYENKRWAELDLWPATIDNVRDLVSEALGGVSLKLYYDYVTKKPSQFDFVQYVISKKA